MLLIYSSADSPRLRYIIDFFSSQLFDQPIGITTDRVRYLSHDGPKLNYSDAPLAEVEYRIHPVTLLFETGIRRQEVSCFTPLSHKAFFRTAGDHAFDVFAAAFYLLSRYEEYLPHQQDDYGRYAYQYSLAFREGFLREPLVNIWLEELMESLRQRFPGIMFRSRQFNCLLTYDIDIAYAYKNRGWALATAGLGKSLLNRNWKEAGQRWRVINGRERDPNDCFEWLDALHLYCRVKPVYFFLVAKHRSQYDRNCPTSVRPFRELIEYYSRHYKLGLHPSWRSGDQPELLKEELEWLEVVADHPVVASRQHYLRFTLPQTYRLLLQAGIRKEYSMGYGTVNGFRASVASSFHWYDLEQEKATDLQLYPFCFMDTTSHFQMNHSPGQAYQELIHFYSLIKRYQGLFISIWHNTLLGTNPAFSGWREMYEVFMKETVYWDAYYDGR